MTYWLSRHYVAGAGNVYAICDREARINIGESRSRPTAGGNFIVFMDTTEAGYLFKKHYFLKLVVFLTHGNITRYLGHKLFPVKRNVDKGKTNLYKENLKKKLVIFLMLKKKKKQ